MEVKLCLSWNRDLSSSDNLPVWLPIFRTTRKIWCNPTVCGCANNTGFRANRSENLFLIFSRFAGRYPSAPRLVFQKIL